MVFFTVSLINGREEPALYHDELPVRVPIRNLVYVTVLHRVDARRPLSQLWEMFQRLRAKGELPPQWQPPPRPQAAAAKILLGHRENQADVVRRTRQVHPVD